MSKKTVYTLNVNNYAPEIRAIWHEYLVTEKEKLAMMKKVLSAWTGGQFK